jgi:hypothetical protein
MLNGKGKYNHAYTFGFSVNSNNQDGDPIKDIALLREVIAHRLAEMSDLDLAENLGYPFDTYENWEV